MKPYLVTVELEIEVDAPNEEEARQMVEDGLLDLKLEDLPFPLMDFEVAKVEAEELRDDDLPPEQLELPYEQEEF